MKDPGRPVTLKDLAGILELSPGTVSRIMNGQGSESRIAKETQERVLHAAALYGYSPNALAQSLRLKKTYTIGVIVPEISEGYSTAVLSGIEDELLKDGYFYFVVSHRHKPELLDGYPRMLVSRSVEGIIAVDTHIGYHLPVPLIAVSGHNHPKGSICIQLDHDRAAHLALSHLKALGHKRIAFIKGQAFSSDTLQRWNSIARAAKDLNIKLDPRLIVQLKDPDAGPGPGLEITRALLSEGHSFTALFAFNDVTAIGAIQALREIGFRVPKDVSVIGFDDVFAASAHSPQLTTIRQPLRDMGQSAALTLLRRIRNEVSDHEPATIQVLPQLIVRKSTAMVPSDGPTVRST
jgi:LacI family transcriptional regulator